MYSTQPALPTAKYRSRIMITYGTDCEPVVCRIASNLDKGFDCFLDSDSVGQDELDQRLKEVLLECLLSIYIVFMYQGFINILMSYAILLLGLFE